MRKRQIVHARPISDGWHVRYASKNSVGTIIIENVYSKKKPKGNYQERGGIKVGDVVFIKAYVVEVGHLSDVVIMGGWKIDTIFHRRLIKQEEFMNKKFDQLYLSKDELKKDGKKKVACLEAIVKGLAAVFKSACCGTFGARWYARLEKQARRSGRHPFGYAADVLLK